MSRIDDISPGYVGEDKIALSIDRRSKVLAGKPIMLLIDYSNAEDGVVPPLEVVVQPAFGDGDGYQRTVYQRAPTRHVFTPKHAGEYLLHVRELKHNKWQGRLLIGVSGEAPLQARDERGVGSLILIDNDFSPLIDADGRGLIE